MPAVQSYYVDLALSEVITKSKGGDWAGRLNHDPKNLDPHCFYNRRGSHRAIAHLPLGHRDARDRTGW